MKPRSFTRCLQMAMAAFALMAGSIAQADGLPSYQYYRFKVEATKGDGANMMQFSELRLYNEDTDVTSGGTLSYDSTTLNSETVNYPAAESPDNAIDGDTTTKWLDFRCKAGESAAVRDAVWIVLDFGQAQTVTKYEWYTANDATERNPSSWRFQGSDDASTWVDLDVQSGFPSTSAYFSLAYAHSFKAVVGDGAFPGGVLRNMLHLGAAEGINPPSSLGGLMVDILAAAGGEANQNPLPGQSVTLGGASYVWTQLENSRADGHWCHEVADGYIAYLHAYLYLDDTQPRAVTWSFAHDDGMCVWVNGRNIHRHNAYDGNAHTVSDHLEPGLNSVTMKIEEGGGGDFLYAALDDGAGNEGISYTFNPAFSVESLDGRPNTVTNGTVRVAAWPSLDGYDSYQITTGFAAPVAGEWLQYTPGEAPADPIAFTLPATDQAVYFTLHLRGTGVDDVSFTDSIFRYVDGLPTAAAGTLTVISPDAIGHRFTPAEIASLARESYSGVGGIVSASVSPESIAESGNVTLTVCNEAGNTASAQVAVNVYPDSGPITQQDGYLRDMLHLGVNFDTDDLVESKGIDYDFLSEYGGEANQLPWPGLVYTGLATSGTSQEPAGQLTWTPAHAAVDGSQTWVPNGRDYYIKYWHVYVYCPDERITRLCTYSDDDLRVWINGKKVVTTGYATSLKTDGVQLRKGLNAVTVKLREGNGGDFMGISIRPESGANTWGDLRYQFHPDFLIEDAASGNRRMTGSGAVKVLYMPRFPGYTRYQIVQDDASGSATPDASAWAAYDPDVVPADSFAYTAPAVGAPLYMTVFLSNADGTVATNFTASLDVDDTPPVIAVKDFTCVIANANVGATILGRDVDNGSADAESGIASITVEPSVVKADTDVLVTVMNGAGLTSSATVHITTLPGYGPLPAGYIRTMLHLGHSLATDDLTQNGGIGGDQLSGAGGQANMHPYPGMVVTGLSTSGSSKEPAGQLTWTPAHIDDPQQWRPSYDGDGRNNYIKYWHIYIVSPDDREIDWRHLSDDGMRLWVNGELQVSSDGVSDTTTRGRLFAGLNSIMVKLEEGGGGDYLDLALRIPGTSNYFDDLIYALEPSSFKVGCPETGSEEFVGRGAVAIQGMPVVTTATQYQCVRSDAAPAADGWKSYTPGETPSNLVFFATPSEGAKLTFALYLRDANGDSVGEYTSQEITYTQVAPVARAKSAKLEIDTTLGTTVKVSDIDDGSYDTVSGIYSMWVDPNPITEGGAVTLYVMNNAGLVSSAPATIYTAFWCDFEADAVKGLGSLSSTYTAGAYGTPEDLVGLAYTWTFGDGTVVAGSGDEYASVEHEFLSPGRYDVSLEIRNGLGETVACTNRGYVAVLSDHVYLSTNGAAIYPYDTWANAARDPHDALDAAVEAVTDFNASAATVEVGPGAYSYVGSLEIYQPVKIVSTDGPEETSFRQTRADTRAFYVDNAAALVSGLTVTSERLTSNKQGTAFYIRYGTVSNVVVTACTGGQHGNGGHEGSVYVRHGLLVDSLITNNRDGYNSAAVFVNGDDAVVDRCEISFNYGNTDYHSSDGGGGVRLHAGTVRNCFIHDNETIYQPGGGVRIAGGLLENCTIVNNKAGVGGWGGGGGGGVRHDGGTVRNCIIWDNLSLGESSDYDGSGATYCCAPELVSGTGNISSNPGFADAAATNYTLLASSPCVDAGTAIATNVLYDIALNERVLDGSGSGTPVIDMGAWEYERDADAFDCTFVIDGSSRALGSLEATFVATVFGPAEKLVGVTYAWNFGDGTTTLPNVNAATATHLYDEPGIYTVTLAVEALDGDTASFTREDCITIASDTIYVRDGSESPAFPYSTPATAAATLGDGYNAAQIAVDCGATSVFVDVGAGTFPVSAEMRLESAISIVGAGTDATVLRMIPSNARVAYLGGPGALVANLVVSNANFSTAIAGAGLYIHAGMASNVVVTACSGGNHANGDGLGAGMHGAVYLDGGLLVDSVIRENRHNYNGAAVFVNGSGALVERCEITGNYGNQHDWAGEGGGGVELRYGTVRNCFIHHNTCIDRMGGGVYVRNEGVLESCTVIANEIRSAADTAYGAGVYQNGGTVLNCIIADNWKNTSAATPTASDYETDADWRDVTYTYAPELTYGTGNVTGIGATEPLFRNAESGDYRPSPNGPATRAGTLSAWMDGAVDFDHKRRASGGLVDMGAFARADEGWLLMIR